ncbi:MAG: heme exporter protein CcmD [Rhodobacteraceae bacterium]|nr:heme exporter protein CcmD [Paracoccaceae bacterium]
MPDLGKYAADVLSAYGVAVLLLFALVVISLNQSDRAKRDLDEQESRLRKNDK